MKSANTHRWQQERIKSRSDIISMELDELDKNKIKFYKVTHLARHLAKVIFESENNTLALAKTKGLTVKLSNTSQCRASTLLKSKTYRYQLDLWMTRHHKPKILEDTVILELRMKLLHLSNEHAIALDELRTLREANCSSQNPKAISTTERNDGMTIADILIQHFREFCEIHNGALIEPSPLRPVIVQADLFAEFLQWKSKVY